MKLTPIAILLTCVGTVVSAGQPVIDGCPIFPADNIWNTRIDTMPVDPDSTNYTSTIGDSTGLHADFGSGLLEGAPIGIPYVVVPGTQRLVNITFDYSDESDPGPYPIPPDPPIEGGTNSTGDRHILIIDKDNHKLYETWNSYCTNGDGTWTAGSGAIFALTSNTSRPDGWTSADAAGLPILPGLARYEEVAAGAINHALRFTVPKTQKNTYVWPARHWASLVEGPQYPLFGQRFRLKADFDISSYPPQTRIILTALKKYGMIVADNGSPWYISGAPSEGWDNDDLHTMSHVNGSNFEVVACSALMNNWDSAQVLYPRSCISQVTFTNNAVQLSITSLFPGISNIIERSFDLTSNCWQTNDGFFCEMPTTNWTGTISNSWSNIFYRVKRLQ